MHGVVVLVLGVVSAVYVVIGALIFQHLEEENETAGKATISDFRQQWLSNHSCVSADQFNQLSRVIIAAYRRGALAHNDTPPVTRWNFHSSVYFAVTVVTTIGYGNITPVTLGGQTFCIFFAMVGIPLIFVFLAQIGIKLSIHRNKLTDWLEKIVCPEFSQQYTTSIKVIRLLLIDTLMIVVFVILPSVVFMKSEGWSYGVSLYYAIITLTTVGFGDYVAGFSEAAWSHPGYIIMVAVWIVIGLAWMSSVIAAVQDILGSSLKKADEKAKKKYRGRMSKRATTDGAAHASGDIDLATDESLRKIPTNNEGLSLRVSPVTSQTKCGDAKESYQAEVVENGGIDADVKCVDSKTGCEVTKTSDEGTVS